MPVSAYISITFSNLKQHGDSHYQILSPFEILVIMLSCSFILTASLIFLTRRLYQECYTFRISDQIETIMQRYSDVFQNVQVEKETPGKLPVLQMLQK